MLFSSGLLLTKRLFVRRARCVSSLHRLSTITSEPLRILFCGSDEFSCATVKAVYDAREELGVDVLEIMCRPGKPSGRGLKTIREVPIRDFARGLDLRCHEQDTFTNWTIPRTEMGRMFNLIIAVSFGLFVPSRILNSIRYGGLNVHPSLLPDLRGPAPLHHTLLRGDTQTGVTLQTLHPDKFDHGKILLQRPFNINASAEEKNPYVSLLRQVCEEAKSLLVQGLREKAYLPDYEHSRPLTSQVVTRIQYAPKITNADRQLKFDKSSITQMIRQEKVLGKVWCYTRLNGSNTGKPKRLILSDLSYAATTDLQGSQGGRVKSRSNKLMTTIGIYPTFMPAYRIQIIAYEEDSRIFLPLEDDGVMVVGQITVEGEEKKNAKLALFGKSEVQRNTCRFDPGPNEDVV